MKKSELATALASRTGMTKANAGEVLTELAVIITESLKKGEKVQWTKFGTWESKLRPGRNGVNPSSQKKIWIEEKNVVRFHAAKALKESVA